MKNLAILLASSVMMFSSFALAADVAKDDKKKKEDTQMQTEPAVDATHSETPETKTESPAPASSGH
ncbi:MAG: hypothetical protein EB127_04345 [Alphaproteobacteria bacterium]|nr:hypothetical protein [Alphaproteobacteria bacterium]